MKNGKATVVTGTADSNTGYAKRNEYLSKKRAEYLKKILAEKYGVNVGDYVVNTNISAEGNPELQRAAIISFE